MEPTVDMDKMRGELEELNTEFQTLRERESSLQQQVNTHEWYFNLVRPACYALAGIVTIVLLLLGFKGIPELRDYVVATARTAIDKAMRETVEPKIAFVENVFDEKLKSAKNDFDDRMVLAKNDFDGKLQTLEGQLNAEMDDLVRTNREFLEVIDEVKDKKLPKSALHRLPKQRVQSDGLFNIYTDALVKWGEYEAAYKFLCELKNQGKFPKKFNWPDSYSQGALIQWVNALSSSDGAGETQEAGEWLIEAWKRALPGVGHARMEVRRPLELLVFLRLSQNNKDEAKYYAEEAKKWGTTRTDLSGYTTWPWFEKLKVKNESIQQDLEEILTTTFPGEKTGG